MRGESFGTRRPPTSAVSPPSPVRVYTRVMLMVIGLRLLATKSTRVFYLNLHTRPGDDPPVSSRPRAVLATASSTHFVHDGFSDILYVLLPVWATEFGLSLVQVGLLRTAYTGGMALFQIPAGLLA